jgi:hypothetical protein
MTEMKPALTAEEWKEYMADDLYSTWLLAPTYISRAVDNMEFFGDNRLHDIAAIALHKQPFGFTREDVKNLNFVLKRLNGLISDDRFARLGDLSDRISALLPPEEQERA